MPSLSKINRAGPITKPLYVIGRSPVIFRAGSCKADNGKNEIPVKTPSPPKETKADALSIFTNLFDPCCKYESIYDIRKYSHYLPREDVCPPFCVLAGMPSGIFRNTCGENLGPNASKAGCYKNPEYYSFHHMTYYDMHMLLRPYRLPSPPSGRKP